MGRETKVSQLLTKPLLCAVFQHTGNFNRYMVLMKEQHAPHHRVNGKDAMLREGNTLLTKGGQAKICSDSLVFIGNTQHIFVA